MFRNSGDLLRDGEEFPEIELQSRKTVSYLEFDAHYDSP
jgi:hypothetical protein